MELFKQRADINIVHIPYKGSGPAYTDLMGGQLDVMFDSLPGAMNLARANKVRILAVSTLKRDPIVPDVPTLSESGLAGFDVLGWLGVVGPAGLNAGVRDKIHDGLKKALSSESVEQSMVKIGMMPVGGSSDDFGKYIASEFIRWGGVIKTGNIKAE